jgi:hypothetical protein
MGGGSNHGSRVSTSTNNSNQYNNSHYNTGNNNYHGNRNHYRKKQPRSFFGLLWFALKGAYTSTRSFIIVGRMRGKPIILTDHAKERMDQRHITIDEIRQALRKGKLNDKKSEPKEKPFPKYVVNAILRNAQPGNNRKRTKEVEIVLAAHKDETIVVTVIDKDTDWPTDDGH